MLTATKALKVKEIVKLSGCSFLDIPLPLLDRGHVLEMIHDLHDRALQAPSSSVAHALSALRLADNVPPLMSHLLELMAGHPRFLEKLLFHLGRPEGHTDCWTPATFIARMAALRAPTAGSIRLEDVLVPISDAIASRYSAFKGYMDQPKFSAIVPQLVGYTLFEWPVTRQLMLTEDGYQCSVRELEEDGIVFLTPVNAALSSSSAVTSAISSAPSSSVSSSAFPSSSSNVCADVQLRLVMPFLWLHRVYARHSSNHAVSVVQLPLVKTLTCRLSPAQNEELTMSVLALKCFCLVKMGQQTVTAAMLFGASAGELPVRLPSLPATQWPVVKLRHQVTPAKWVHWSQDQAASPIPRSGFFLNGEKAPFWDGYALTSPPVFVQDKQGLVSREKVAKGTAPEKTKWAEVEAEWDKCKVSDPMQPLFLFCTDAIVTGRPSPLPSGVIVVDQYTQADFFGPLLASRKAMCLSELGASASSAS